MPVNRKLIQDIKKLSENELNEHSAGFSHRIYNKVIAKLKSEAVEDFRIDFEDGFGNRPDAEEDQTAIDAAKAVVEGMH